MDQGQVELGRKDLKRLRILERVVNGTMSFEEGARHLIITERQLRRLRKKYQEEGAAGLVHGNKGRKPAHALSEEIKQQVVSLFEEKYHDSNFTHCADLLAEFESITLSAPSVRRILNNSGHKSKRPIRRRPRKHTRRERRTQAGMLWQIDATPYEWLGRAFGRFTLHAVIDDATGIVTGAGFTRNECAEGYAAAMREGLERYGVPLGLYSDKHTIFRSPKEKLTIDQELDGEQIPLSNFGKAMAELCIEHIKANTPQAKGRIERLWATLQDRLPVELRLMGVRTMAEANGALAVLIAKHNARFAFPPADEQSAYSPLGEGVNLDYVFARREARKVGRGNCISYKGGVYVPADSRSRAFDAKVTVEVRETLAGDVAIWDNGKAVALRRLDAGPATVLKGTSEKKEGKRPYKPAEDHPWRRSVVGRGEGVHPAAVM
jgi:Transposase and inactivated derivatives